MKEGRQEGSRKEGKWEVGKDWQGGRKAERGQGRGSGRGRRDKIVYKGQNNEVRR